jgi:hypothetical protein
MQEIQMKNMEEGGNVGALAIEVQETASTSKRGRRAAALARRQEIEKKAVTSGMDDVKLNAKAIGEQVEQRAQDGISDSVASAIAIADREDGTAMNAYVARKNQNAAKFSGLVEGLTDVLNGRTQKVYEQMDLTAQLNLTPSPFDVGVDFFAQL